MGLKSSGALALLAHTLCRGKIKMYQNERFENEGINPETVNSLQIRSF